MVFEYDVVRLILQCKIEHAYVTLFRNVTYKIYILHGRIVPATSYPVTKDDITLRGYSVRIVARLL